MFSSDVKVIDESISCAFHVGTAQCKPIPDDRDNGRRGHTHNGLCISLSFKQVSAQFKPTPTTAATGGGEIRKTIRPSRRLLLLCQCQRQAYRKDLLEQLVQTVRMQRVPKNRVYGGHAAYRSLRYTRFCRRISSACARERYGQYNIAYRHVLAITPDLQ